MNIDTKDYAASQAALNQQFHATLTNAGTATQAGIANIALVHKARLNEQTRYAASLHKEYGAQDAGTKAAVAKANVTRSAMQRVTSVSARSATPAPAVAASGWALNGRIYDASLLPVAGLTVFLVDGTRAYQEKIGFCYTDKTGYYLLEASTAPVASVPLYIEIANDKGEPIYLDAKARKPVTGQTVYSDIHLVSEKPIGDPPRAVRSTGFPPTENDKS